MTWADLSYWGQHAIALAISFGAAAWLIRRGLSSRSGGACASCGLNKAVRKGPPR